MGEGLSQVHPSHSDPCLRTEPSLAPLCPQSWSRVTDCLPALGTVPPSSLSQLLVSTVPSLDSILPPSLHPGQAFVL